MTSISAQRDSIDARQLRYFIAVAEELHFGRAAARLGIVQPALSLQIRGLEEKLGCELLVRRPHVALTSAGEVLLREARQTLARLAAGLQATRRAADGESGIVSVGYASSAVLSSFAVIISRFRARYPEVTLHLSEVRPADEIELVRQGSIDIAFVREVEIDPDLRYHRVFSEALVAVLPKKHSLARGKSVRLEELANESFVHFPREVSPGLYDQILVLCRGAGFEPRVVQQVREWLTELSLVQAGIGVAIVPASLGKLKFAGVVFRPLRGASAHAIISICCRKRLASEMVKAFLATALDVIGSRAVR